MKLSNKGFSLIEILACIVILGILMGLSIPMVSRLIDNSRKQAYIDSVIAQKNSVKAFITSEKYYVYDKEMVYYFDYRLLVDDEEEKLGRSPFGDWVDCYVVVTYDGKINHFYWTGVDKNGWRIDLRKEVGKLKTSDVYHTSNKRLNPSATIGGRDNITIFRANQDPTETTPSNDMTEAEARQCFQFVDLPDGTYKITNYEKSCGSEVELPSTIDGKVVSIIGENAFLGKGLTKVIMYAGIVTIENGAFQSNSITDVKLSSTLKTIGPYAFYKNKIKNLDMPEGVVTIDTFAFSINEIEYVNFPRTLQTIGSCAFQSNKLSEINLKSNASVGGAAFSKNIVPNESAIIYAYNSEKDQPDYTTIIGYGGNAAKLEIPPYKELGKEKIAPVTIKGNAFSYGTLQEVVMPDTIKTLGGDAFAFNSIKKVKLSNTLETIGTGAFRSNQLTNIDIPASVTLIGNYAFVQNKMTGDNLFIYARSANWYTREDGTKDHIDYSKIVSYGNGKYSGTVTIPGKSKKYNIALQSITSTAFGSCNLTSITLPDPKDAPNLSISNNAFIRNNVEGAAGFMYKMTNGKIDYTILSSYAGPVAGDDNGVITIPGSITITKDGKKTEYKLDRIEGIFTWMSYKKVVIPESVTYIEKGAFARSNRNNLGLRTIVNKTNNAFNWYELLDADQAHKNLATANGESLTFKTGTVRHQSGNVTITNS